MAPGREGTLTAMERQRPSRVSIAGFPGLWRQGSGGTWRINRTVRGVYYRLDLGVTQEESAKRLYVEFEVDPDALAARLGRIVQPHLRKRLLSEELKRWVRATKRVDKTRQRSIVMDFIRRVGDLEMREVNDRVIGEYVEGMKGRLRPATQVLHFSTLRTFFAFAHADGCLPKKVMVEIPRPKNGKALEHRRRVVEKGEIEAVLARLKKYWTRAVVHIMWATGLDYADVMGLKGVHLNQETRTIRKARRKSGVVATVPVVDDAVWSACGWLVRKLRERGRPYDYSSFASLVRNAAAAAGVPPFSSKALRHTRITLWLREGQTIYDVAQWVGHADIAQTMKYIEASQSEARPNKTDLADIPGGLK